MSAPTAHDELAIRNTLSRYCEALDTKMLNLLDKVFIPDVIADYPFNSNMKGVDAVRSAIQNRYIPQYFLNRCYPRKIPFPSYSHIHSEKHLFLCSTLPH
jgi:hypothetical protein